MPLDAQKYKKLKGMLDSGAELSDEVRSEALAAIGDYENQFLDQGWGGAQNRPAEGASVPQPASTPTNEGVAQELLRRLDPSMPVAAQALAIQPSTTHPKGDQAAAAEWSTGRLDNPNGVTVVYEAPVAKVRERLAENPSLFQALGYDAPMTPEAVATIEEGDPIHKSFNDYEWRRVADEASKAGRTAYRYSRAPFMHGGEHGGALDTLGAKLKFGALPALDIGTSFVMGYDEAASFGAATRAAESGLLDQQGEKPPAPGKVSGSVKLDTGGKNEAVGLAAQNGESTEEQLDVLREEHPGAVMAGNVLGTVPGLVAGAAKGAVGAVSRTGGEVAERGLKALEHWNPANSLWEWVTNGGKGWVSEAANPLVKLGSDVLHAGAGAAADQLVREGVRAGAELAGTGETSVTARGALDRGVDAAKFGALIGAAPALASRSGSAGKRLVEDRFPHLEAAAPHLQWGASSVVTGPRLKPETAARVRDARKRNVSPVGTLAEEVAPAIQETAAAGTKTARDRAVVERRAHQNTPEGMAPQPATHLERMSLEKLRDHHQPQPGGAQRPVDETYRDAQRVFNRHIEAVSLEPVKGAVELTADEANSFLGAQARRQIVEDDIAAVARKNKGKPVDRAAYLGSKNERLRKGIEEEIDSDIDQLLPDKNVDKRSARYKEAEQKVLRARVETEMVLEPFGGSLGEYLKQRGKSTVYVKPAAYDARRIDSLVDGLKDPDLIEAAKYDRQQIPKDGERGGYELMRRRQERDIKKAEDTEKAVAPEGDAFKPLVRHGFPRAGDERDAAAMQRVADAAGPGVRKKVDDIRSLNSALDVTGRAWFGGKEGGKQGVLSLGNQADAVSLRAYPVLRSLDTMGGLARGGAGRLESLGAGNDEAEARRKARDDKRAPAYRAAVKGQGGRGNATDRRAKLSAARKKKLERARAARQRRQADRVE